MIHLRALHLNLETCQKNQFPLNLPVLKNLSRLKFTSPVAIFIGSNGSGKSTLMEALALTAGSIAVGSEDVNRDQTLGQITPLAETMKLVWNKKTHRGFFLRAEDFFGYIKRTRELRMALKEESSRIDLEFSNRSDYARSLAKSPVEASLNAMENRYGQDLGECSHGEGFLALFQSRFVPNGLYLLDEPEAALSPLSQLGLISLIKSMVEEGGQFIIATHSPILMAIPKAQLLNFDHSPPVETDFDDLEHVQLYRHFLDSPKAYIEKL